MKKLIAHAALLAIFIHPIIFGQSGWVWLNPLPQGNYLNNVSYVNSSLVYVSGAGGTLMKSTNGGLNFSVIPTGIRESLSLNFINELTGFSPSGSGILRTTDGGQSWIYSHLLSDYSATQIQYVNNQLVFALTRKEIGSGNYSTYIYKSNDLGLSWAITLSPTLNTQVNSFHFINNQTGYAVGRRQPFYYSKIYRTTNSGATWDTIPSNIRTEFKASYFMNYSTGFVCAGLYVGGILRTTNACLGWDTVHSGGFYSIKFFDALSGYAEGSGTIALTSNGGINWQNSYVDKDIYLCDLNNGLGIYEDYYRKNFLYRTTNSGSNWTQITQGFSDQLWDVCFTNENTGFTAGHGFIYSTTNSGMNWSIFNLNIYNYPPVENIMFVNENTGFAGLDYGWIAKTTNCGINWQTYETGCYDHNHGMAFPSADTGYAVTKYGFYLKTINGGVNWVTLQHVQGHYFGDVYFVDNMTGFAGGSAPRGFIARTTNGGINWTSISLDSIIWVNDVCVSDSSTWFAAGQGDSYSSGYAGYINRSTNSGLNWSFIGFDKPIFAIFFPTKQVGYASSYGNVMYKTTNGGDSWFPTECIYAHESYGIYFTNENTGYAVGLGGQIIKTTTGGGNFIGVNPVSTEVPKQFILHQNYPNPFNPVTRIKIQVAGNTTVKLTIYDVIGREIETLANEQLKPGLYEVTWDGTNYPSGVYFYRLTTNQFTQTRKMVLLK